MKGLTICLWLAAGTALFGQTQSADRVIPAEPPTYVPMTQNKRLKRYLKDTVDPIAFLRSGASAGFGQWRDRPKEWGEGSAAFGKRYASSFAEHITISSIMFGASSLLHEDNRYLPSGKTGAAPRVRYALESSFLARHNDGTRHVSISKLGAFAAAALISRRWQPHSSRGFGSAASNFSVTFSVAAGFDVMREFLPDLLHRK